MKYSNIFIIYITSFTWFLQETGSLYQIQFVPLKLCPAYNLLELNKWQFSPSLLCKALPCRKQRSGFIGVTNDVSFSIVDPIKLSKKIKLVAISDDVLANILDLDPGKIVELPYFAEFAGGNYILPSSTPIAHRYGGHQFGSWAGQLGDGRAILLGEYVNRHGRRWELQLKGSGRTPYSRHGDGRAVVRSSVREFLASEAMHYLGIPTSRAASLIVGQDEVWRDQFYDGHPNKERIAVVLRLAHSWFRIGSLEVLTLNGEIGLLRKTVDFIIEQHFSHLDVRKNKYEEFFADVVHNTADMIAKWQSVGFAHGVCNTDNFSLMSITIDYGPFGFMDGYNPKFVPNTSDDEGRYSYENQPDVGYFNLNKLRLALAPLISEKRSSDILKNYSSIFTRKYNELFRLKLGLLNEMPDDALLVEKLLTMMRETKADFTMTFRGLSERTLREQNDPEIIKEHWALSDLSKHRNWKEWLNHYHRRLLLHNGENDNDIKRQNRMKERNPLYILRNWMAEKAIKMTEIDDFSEVRNLLKILENPFVSQEIAERSGYSSRPPSWASKLRVSCSS
ncbi:uncharacterized protein LOC114524206 [Dendronephthya gigantea]|uniref:uncharacterized protein LOC114524206 n=1 Tax=Dendronephthya gigantea TaxID=151771 RepID=UPI00106C4F05|nr:uncharacterized protein LOC114524206 [Dendronephthya gigantea]